MKKNVIFLLSFVLFFFVSCNQTPKSSKLESINDSDMNETIGGDSIVACQHASKILWKGSKPGGDHNGLIKITQGKYIVENDELLGGWFIIDMNSIVDIDIEDEAMNTKLVNHLKSGDFFNTDSFPEGRFVITKVIELSGSGFSHEITGDLTLKAITHSIVFNANVKVDDGVVSATSEEFLLDRTQWGINYKSKSIIQELKDKFIDDEFSVVLHMHSMK